MDISETIAASGLKNCRCKQLIQQMKVNEYLRSRSFLDLVFSRFCMFCANTRPRYQVSIYRTIGPLISSPDLVRLPEPMVHGCAYSIPVKPSVCASVRVFTLSNIEYL